MLYVQSCQLLFSTLQLRRNILVYLNKSSSFDRLIAIRIILIAAIFSVCGSVTAETVKIAFTGDQGVGDNARSVLQLIAEEGADLLMIQGDLGYGATAATQWETNLNDRFGPEFPVLVVAGNHENYEWPLYKSLTKKRIDRSDKLSCNGDIGVKAICQFKNIDIVQVSPGIHEVVGVRGEDKYAEFIRSSFSGTTDQWRICSWHKNQNALQTGKKGNATGWDVYNECLDAGAMVAVAHEHAYSRSYLLSDFENQTVVHRENTMTLQSGQSFVFVSGLGGREVRMQERGGDWWASIYTASQGATHGALFCEFDSNLAECYFKAVDGSVPDQFTLRRGTTQTQAVPSTTQSATALQVGYVFSRTDIEEYRWIDKTESGGLGNIWIDRTCADQLGGASVNGDWGDLDVIAPAMDSIANPCDNNGLPIPRSLIEKGYVFSRSDKDEYRWIDHNANGEIGSIWIDEVCATSLGGYTTSGDWSHLMDIAPAIDSIANPCINSVQSDLSSVSSVASGFVFGRSDKDEYRWVGQDNSGHTGNVWIDQICAERLGGAMMIGGWSELNELSPRFDAIPSPCE